MKIKTITCHNVYNYGASLQAYALQHFLESKGYEVEIINYMPDYLSFHYRISSYISSDEYRYKPSLKYWPIKMIYILYRYILSINGLSRKKSFDIFTKSYLNLTKKYSSFEQLSKCPPLADLYIAGSDQIWNSKFMENGKDPAFYLNFVKSRKKISYAASFGANDIDSGCCKEIIEWLSNLDSISVREKNGSDIINKYGITSDVVCDPVFLLNTGSWSKICKSLIREKYILIYNIGPINTKLVATAEKLSKVLGLTIVSIKDTYRVDKAAIYIDDAGPCEFISLIKGAEFVLSNSFHATAFSIIFQKQFYTFIFNNINSSSRMLNLLNIMNLENRFDPNIEDSIEVIDYKSVEENLKKYKENSENWLLKNLTNKR